MIDLSAFQSLLSILRLPIRTNEPLARYTTARMASAAVQANSRVLINQSRISDIQSYLVVMSAIQSDIYSALGAGVPLDASTISDIRSAIAATELDASDLSDIASAVWANSIGTRVDSRVLLNQSRISDVQSALAAGVPLDTPTMSDLRSAIAAQTATVSASDISDIASAVRATLVSDLSDILSAAQQTNSRTLVVQSRLDQK